MELVTEPDTYAPGMDDMGNYIDRVPPFNTIKHGIRCPCGSRKDKIYETHNVFSQHVKTKAHQKWLQNLNLNRANYYIENEELKTTVQQQRMVIAKLEKELQNRNMTVDFLTQQLATKKENKPVVDNLLDFDWYYILMTFGNFALFLISINSSSVVKSLQLFYCMTVVIFW